MLTISFTLIIGIAIGSFVCAKYLNKSHATNLKALEQELAKNVLDQDSACKSINAELISVKKDSQEQKEITIEKISEAFHAGSQMMEEMASSLNNILELVSKTETPIQNISESSDTAQGMIDNSRNSMENMSTSLNELTSISEIVGELCEHMNQVNEKTEVIHNIANQANLLSLNASIEAARAGEAGRGFSVVANDMNRLSDLSATAAQEISHILSSGLKNIEKITVEMDNKIKSFTGVSNKMINCFQNMGDAVQSIGSITETLRNDSQSTIDGVKKVSDNTMTTMESLTKMLSDVTGIISGNIILDIEPREVYDYLNEYTIIDVRNPKEFNDELSHLEQATLYCLQDNFKEAISGMDKDKKYLFVCRSGGRSARGARIAQALGFTDVSNLSGGMLKWREAYPLHA